MEKGIDYDTMLIDLRDKPEWYHTVASNEQTPAARIDGRYMCESMDIMKVRITCRMAAAHVVNKHLVHQDTQLVPIGDQFFRSFSYLAGTSIFVRYTATCGGCLNPRVMALLCMMCLSRW